MNKKFLVLLATIAFSPLNLVPLRASAEGQADPLEIAILKAEKKLVTKELANPNLAEHGRKEREEFQEAVTRAISGALNPAIKFGTTAFAGAGMFYLGAEQASPGINAVTRTFVNNGAVSFVPLAPSTTDVMVNGVSGLASPLFDKQITKMALSQNILPVVTVASDPTHVYLVKDYISGKMVLENRSVDNVTDLPLNDATAAAALGLYALAGTRNSVIYNSTNSTPLVFAAVGDNAAFNMTTDAKRGISVVSVQNNFLNPLNATNFTLPGGAANQAAGLPFSLMQIGGAASFDTNAAIDMHWDENFQRLYIAVSKLKSGTGNNADGVVGLLVGRFDTSGNGTLILEPAVALNIALFNHTNDDLAATHIVGGVQNAADLTVNLNKVRTMHTSTGRDYVIVNGGVNNTAAAGVVDVNSWLFALPIVPAKGNGPADIGKLAKNTGGAAPFTLVSAVGEMTKVDRTNNPSTVTLDYLKAVIGADPRLISANTTLQIQDMQVVGDTVYVAVAGDKLSTNALAGIFSSTALFDVNGVIRSWTPWQRVMGRADAVFGFGLDTQTGNFWDLTTADGSSAADKTTVRVTQWGKSEGVTAMPSAEQNKISSILETAFPQDEGGVHQIFTFDEKTPGFKTTEFAMAVAVGLETVSLIQTGEKQGAVTGLLKPSVIDTTKIFTFGGSTGFLAPAIAAIGPVCCAEVSRPATASSTNGWLFVGGYKGVAVLSKADGSGFNATAGLAGLSLTTGQYPGTEFSFTQLMLPVSSNFANTRKLISDGANLYVLTRDNLYRFPMQAGSFSTTPPATPIVVNASTAAPAGTYFSDVIIVNQKAILATSSGLYVWDATTPATPPTLVTDSPAGQIVHMQYLSESKGVTSSKGNLYVLAGDISKPTGKIYRFDIDGTAALANVVKPIVSFDPKTGLPPTTPTNGLFTDFKQFRGNIMTDGALLASMRSKHFEDTNFLNITPVANVIVAGAQITGLLDINTLDVTTALNYNVGLMVRDSASGALMLPGDWGLRVNQ